MNVTVLRRKTAAHGTISPADIFFLFFWPIAKLFQLQPAASGNLLRRYQPFEPPMAYVTRNRAEFLSNIRPEEDD